MRENVVIRVKNMTVRYKDCVAVDHISFDVREGEIFGLIGPNGAGKTSTIECLEGLRKLSDGVADLMGVNPKERKKLYKYIGVQLQEASFPSDIKVEELCKLFASFYENPADYHVLLEQFDLTEKKKSYLKKLSGGQRQRVSILLALISNPQIVFLDELTTGLDPQARIGMWEFIKLLRDQGKTIFMTTHFMEEAEYLCDRVCMMVKGKIAAMGSVKELVAQADLSRKISFTSVNARKDGLNRIQGVTRVTADGAFFAVYGKHEDLQRNVMVYLTENDIIFNDYVCSSPNLEDAFLKLTGFRLEGTA